MFLILAVVSLIGALLPLALFFANLRLFSPPAAVRPGPHCRTVSVLIPARNEEENIGPALQAALASEHVEFEIIVLDDASTDGTAKRVAEMARQDERIKLAHAPALPAGWNGKQHACHILAGLAQYPRLLFLDADVRLAPDALPRLLERLEGVDLLSGVPRQLTGTFSEKLLIPLIHFILLGYLPLARMRRASDPSLGAGCGQLFLTTEEAYRKAGGHAAIRASIHDGLHLPRLYRKSGLRTDLVDITALATCRMYYTNLATWRGLAKNAHEGMGAWRVIFPMTFLLLCGQVLPWFLLVVGLVVPLSGWVWTLAGFSALSGLFVRWRAARLFHQSRLGAMLHPLGVLSLLAIQWWARLRQSADAGSQWKGRTYR